MATITIPPTIKNTISGAVSAILAGVSVPQERTDAALDAFFDELNGDGGTHTLTNAEPLDRAVKRIVAAEILGVSKFTVSHMVKDGKLHAVYGGKDGKRLTGISEASLRAFMAQGKEVK